jgi:hypothetical protein
MFFSFENMVVKQRNDGKCVCKGIVPIPLPKDFEPAIVAAMKVSNDDSESSGATGYKKSWSGQIITDRDGALWDNLENIFQWASKYQAKTEIYQALRMRGTCESPYHGIAAALETYADLQITGLIIEVADRPNQYSLALGAAVLVTKKEALARTGKKWKMNAVRSKPILKQVRFSDDAKLVKCSMDELVGLAFATQLPVIIQDSVYEAVNVDGLLEKKASPLSMSSKLVMTSPYFSTLEDARAWKQAKRQARVENEMKRKRAAKQVAKAYEIKDASTFLRMRVAEKRACLRATGVFELPRPREGPRAVDAMMIPLLDEEVAYEVLRRLAETKGNFAEAAEMEDFESKKPM